MFDRLVLIFVYIELGLIGFRGVLFNLNIDAALATSILVLSLIVVYLFHEAKAQPEASTEQQQAEPPPAVSLDKAA